MHLDLEGIFFKNGSLAKMFLTLPRRAHENYVLQLKQSDALKLFPI